MARLRYRNGAVVDVPKGRVETLLRTGFTAADEPKKSTPKASSSKTKK